MTAPSRFERIDLKRLYTYEIVIRLLLALCAYALPEVFFADVQYYLISGEKVALDHLPYRDFVWEYPPLMTGVLALVLIAAKNTIAFHLLFLLCTVLAEWGSMHLIRRFDKDNFWLITKFWTITMLPIGLLAWNRLDYFSLFFATIALVAFLQGRSAVWATLLGFLSKLWPILIVVGLFARRRFKEAAFIVVACGAATLAWYLFSPDGFHKFMTFRRGDGFQIESLPGSILHLTGRPFFFKYGTVSISDAGFHWLQVLLFVATFGGLTAMAIAGYFRKHDEVLLIGACVALTLVSSRIISAQFLVWLAPFIALRLRTHPRLAIQYFIAIALTLTFLGGYTQMAWEKSWGFFTFVLVARNLLLLTLTIDMIQSAFRPKLQTGEKSSVNNRGVYGTG